MGAVQFLVEGQALVVQVGGGGHHRGTAAQQLACDGSGNGVRGGTRDHGNILGVRQCAGIQRLGRQLIKAPVLGLAGNGLAGAGDVHVLGIQNADGHAGDILAGGRPAVVQQHGLVGVECGGNEARPIRAEFLSHHVEDGGVGILIVQVDGAVRLQAQLLQDRAGGFRQHTGLAGHLLGVLAQRGGIHHATRAASTAGRQRDGHAVVRGDLSHRGVDKCIKLAGAGGCDGAECGQVATAQRRALAGTNDHGGGDVIRPTLA